MLSLLASLVLAQSNVPRFEKASPLPGLPSIMVDSLGTGNGLAQQLSRARNAQARILWIDGTANIGRYNSEAKIIALVGQIARAGFNTVVFDVKPISGQTIYNSIYAPKLTEWRGQTLDPNFDPLPIMVRECHAQKLSINVSLNAFSEGHRMFLVGPGYAKRDQQTVLYETKPFAVLGEERAPLSPVADKMELGQVAVFSTADKAAKSNQFVVTVRKDGKILSTWDPLSPTVGPDGTTTASPKAPPRNGAILVGDWLRSRVHIGETLRLDTEADFVPVSDRPEQQIPLMMNPNHPEVRRYALAIAQEVARKYEIDGLIYDDRLRYGALNADFSEITRSLFETKVGKKLNWPDDVFKFTVNLNLARGVQPGPYYDAWMAWRAERMRDFVLTIKRGIRAVRPGIQMGIYAGSWYGDYPALGHNYASQKADAGFWFLSPNYAKTGTADLADFLISGCYYPTATIYDAFTKGIGIGFSVESAATLVNSLVRDETWSYAGIALSDFRDDPLGLGNALQAACASSQGVMVFDLSHDIEPMWPVFSRAFAQPKMAPHRMAGLTQELTRQRKQFEAHGHRRPPVTIAAGSAGTGQ